MSTLARRLVQLSLWLLACLVCASHVHAQEENRTTAVTALYVRTDTDDTTVITPRLRVGAPLAENTRADVVYTADIWTSASIDIRTSASRQLSPRGVFLEPIAVREQRDEIDATLQQVVDDVTLAGTYRYSTEHDYESHGGALDVGYDFADNNANLALGIRAYFDRVGRAGDPFFEEPASTLSVRGAFSQVLDTHSLLQLVYELGYLQGFLSSPYRYVRFAPDLGSVPSTCAAPVAMCQLEVQPGARLRHALGLYARRAFGDHVSLGASYRFYIDNWDLLSHAAAADVAFTFSDSLLISLGYRFYHQGSAFFFQPFYRPMPMPRYYTSDKELSSLTSHRVELELANSWTLDARDTELKLVLLVAPSWFLYHEFYPIARIDALETSLAVEVTL